MTVITRPGNGGSQLGYILASNLLLGLGIIIFGIGLLRPHTSLPSKAATSHEIASEEPPEPQFDRVVFMVVDALRSDMVFSNTSGFHFTQSLINSGHAVPFTSQADPPSLTVPRLKTITTGANPSFLDLFLNLADSEDALTLESEDSWLRRLEAKHPTRKLVFYGEHTWLQLFPSLFNRSETVSTFFLPDSTTGDQNITSHALAELQKDDWSALVLHFPGVDHIGHLRGPYSRDMFLKQQQMDRVVEDIYSAVTEQGHLNSTLFVLAGDHGMNEKGNHGGCTPGETAAALLFVSPRFGDMSCPRSQAPAQPSGGEFLYYDVVHQADLVPTISGLLGLPIPWKNVGVFIPAFLGLWPEEARLEIVKDNEAQLRSLVELQYPGETAGSTAPVPGRTGADNESDIHRQFKICRQSQKAMTVSSGNLHYLLLAGGALNILLALALAVHTSRPYMDPGTTLWLFLTAFLGSYGYALVSEAVEERVVWQYGALLAVLLQCPVKRPRGIAHFSIVILLGRFCQQWNSGRPGEPGAVFRTQSAANWLLVAVTIASANFTLQNGLRGMFTLKRTVLAVGIVPLGLQTFVVKLASAVKDEPGSLGFIPAHVEARLLDIDVGFAHNVLFTTLRLVVVMVLTRRCFGGHIGRFTDVLYALFGLLQLYLLGLSRVWNIPLFGVFGLQIDLLSPYVAEMSNEQISIICAFLAQSAYFSFGNTQAIGSTDLAPGFIGSSSYSLVAVAVKTILGNWSGPIWWSLASLVLLADKMRVRTSPRKAGIRLPSDYEDMYTPFVRNLGVQTIIMCAISIVLTGCIAWIGDRQVVWDHHAPRFIFLCVYIVFVHFTCAIVVTASLGWCWAEQRVLSVRRVGFW